MPNILKTLFCLSLCGAAFGQGTTVLPKTTLLPKTTILKPGSGVTLNHANICGATSSAANCTLTNSVSSGHGIFVLFQTGTAAGTITAVTDGGDTFTEVTSANIICGSILNDIWYTPSTGGSRTVLNATTSSGNQWFAIVYDASGTNASSPLDQHATVTSSGVNAAGAAVTTTAASELIISTEVVGGSVSAVTTPFTLDSTQNSGGGWASLVTSSTGTYTPNWTSSGAGANCGSTASFKP